MILVIDTKKETVKVESGKPSVEDICNEIKKLEKWTSYSIQYNETKFILEKPNAN